jgi:hypothetical protein
MRGEAERQVPLMTLTTPERRFPQDHPIRQIKALADAELARLSPCSTPCTASGADPRSRPRCSSRAAC